MELVNEKIKSEIEYNLRKYKRWKARLKEVDELLADVSLAGSTFEKIGSGSGGGVSDPVSKEASRREKLNKERSILIRKISQIEHSIEAMNEQQKKVVEHRYFENLHRKSTLIELAIEKSTYYRIVDEAIEVFAEVSGLMPTVDLEQKNAVNH